MTIQQKLQLILKLSGVTQEELARRLGVTFVALNRWVNNHAEPRAKARERIAELYLQYTGQKVIPATILEAKKELIKAKQKSYPSPLKEISLHSDIRDQFYLSLTYHSNRIEGSTLSEDDTAGILFRNATIPNKSLVEHLEAKNHQAALECLFDVLHKKQPFTEELILKLHAIVMNAIRVDAGIYRNHNVRILGTYVPTANHLKVPSLMKAVVSDMKKKTADPIRVIAETHSRFEKIHPFEDGNGRVGRLVMYALALRANLPPPVIRSEQKKLYATYLNKAQMDEDVSLLEDFICDALLEGYRILDREL
jgi:Fic family protein